MLILLERTGGQVSALQGALANHISTGGYSGYARGYLNNFDVFLLSSNVIGIETGLIQIQGFRVQNNAIQQETIILQPSTPTPMHLIAILDVKLDAENSSCIFAVQPITTLRKDNIFKTGAGIHQVELARFIVTSTGITDLVKTIEPLELTQEDISELLERVDGAVTIANEAATLAGGLTDSIATANETAQAANDMASNAVEIANTSNETSNAANETAAEALARVIENLGTVLKNENGTNLETAQIGVDLPSNSQLAGKEPAFNILPISKGGTGAETVEYARINLGAAADSEVVKLSGDQTIAGTKTFINIPELPAINPTTSNQATSKTYVDKARIPTLSVRQFTFSGSWPNQTASTSARTFSGTLTLQPLEFISGINFNGTASSSSQNSNILPVMTNVTATIWANNGTIDQSSTITITYNTPYGAGGNAGLTLYGTVFITKLTYN